jgi:hypothetical protein
VKRSPIRQCRLEDYFSISNVLLVCKVKAYLHHCPFTLARHTALFIVRCCCYQGHELKTAPPQSFVSRTSLEDQDVLGHQPIPHHTPTRQSNQESRQKKPSPAQSTSCAAIVTDTADCRTTSHTFSLPSFQPIFPSLYNHAAPSRLGRPAHAQLMAMERHPSMVQRPLHRQVELGESVKRDSSLKRTKNDVMDAILRNEHRRLARTHGSYHERAACRLATLMQE